MIRNAPKNKLRYSLFRWNFHLATRSYKVTFEQQMGDMEKHRRIPHPTTWFWYVSPLARQWRERQLTASSPNCFAAWETKTAEPLPGTSRGGRESLNETCAFVQVRNGRQNYSFWIRVQNVEWNQTILVSHGFTKDGLFTSTLDDWNF